MFTKRCLSLVMVALLAQPQLLVCAGDDADLDQKDAGQEQVVGVSNTTNADLDKVSADPAVHGKQKKEIKIDVKVNEDGSASFGFSTGNRNLDLLILLVVLVGSGYGSALKLGYVGSGQ